MGTLESGIKGFVRQRRISFAKSRFERNLARIIEQTNAHRAKGQPAGSQVYKVLWNKADSRVNQFCTKWGVARSDIEAEVPQLAVVRGLCNPGAGPLKALIGYVIGFALAMMTIGACAAVVSWSYHVVLKHLHF